MDKTVKIPQAIHSTCEGIEQLLCIMDQYNNCKSGDHIILDFFANTWFDANLLPVIYATVYYGKEQGVLSTYRNQHSCKLHRLLIRNGFANACFGLPYEPQESETAIPFKIFSANYTYGFSEYIDAELMRYFPSMDKTVQKIISMYIQELFGNAQIHGACKKVFTCGQHYYVNHKMDFTIVDIGKTFSENVLRYVSDMKLDIPKNTIAWAVEPNHSTKRTSSGGIGLSLMRDFIRYNKGKFQIASGNEFWELNTDKERSQTMKYSFPGTIVNIEIDQNDTNIYVYDKNSLDELF